MRSSRLKDLVGILRRGHAATQLEIVAELQAAGHDVTQATVSRDLQEIGAVKVRSGGALEYRLPDEMPRTPGSELMERNLRRTLARLRFGCEPGRFPGRRRDGPGPCVRGCTRDRSCRARDRRRDGRG